MTTVTPAVTAFNAGLLGPELDGRIDLDFYDKGCKELENNLITAQGEAIERGGTRHIAATADSVKRATLIPFRVSVIAPYMLELGDKIMRFYRDKAQIISGPPVQIATPWSDTQAQALRWTQSADVIYLFHPKVSTRKLSRNSDISWTLAEVDWQEGPYFADNITATTLNPSAVTGTITITASAVTGINDDQGFLSTDIGRLVGITHAAVNGVARITNVQTTVLVDAVVQVDFGAATAQAAWRLGLWSGTTDYPCCGAFFQQRLMVGSNPKGSFPRLDGSTVGDFELFRPGSGADNPISYVFGGKDVPIITDVVPLNQLVVLTRSVPFIFRSQGIDQPLTPTNAKAVPVPGGGGSADVQPIEAQGNGLFLNLHGRKLRELNIPEVDKAQVSDLTERHPSIMRAGRRDTAGGVSRLAWQAEPNNILWGIRNDGALLGFTYNVKEKVIGWHPHRVGGSTVDGAETRTHAMVESHAVIPGVNSDELWLAVRRTVNGATARTVEILEEPLGNDDPREDAFYVDGGLTLDNTGLLIGGSGATLTPAAVTGTNITFTAGAAIFVAGDVGRLIKRLYTDGRDRDGFIVWRVAEAEITAFDTTSVVRCDIRADFPSTATIAAADWRLTVATVSGLGHREGETVQVWGDGAIQDTRVVAAGAITLETPAATVAVGLGFVGVLRPSRPDAGSRQGTAQGKKKRVDQVTFRFRRTIGGTFGPDDDVNDQFTSRVTDDEMDRGPGLFTGDKHAIFRGQWTRDGYVRVTQPDPAPMAISMLTTHYNPKEP